MKFSDVGTGLVFWPVGNGDSSTIVVDGQKVIQIDLHKMAKSEDDNEPKYYDVVDELVTSLGKVDKKPYLSVFALTHPDEDHCKGFAELLEKVTIGELWFSPRIFDEYKNDLCDDAVAFKEEAERRIKRTIEEKGDVESGHRVKIFGYHESIDAGGEYDGLPEDHLVIPGNTVNIIDGEDLTDSIRIFVHAPFKEHLEGDDRNDTSIAFQVTLKRGTGTLKALFFGDLSFQPMEKIYEVTEDASNLHWNIFKVPHHCSKSVLYHVEEGSEDEILQEKLVKSIEDTQLPIGYFVSSSEPIPTSNKPGENPPHAIAKNRYVEIVNNTFYCTQEYPSPKKTLPLVFKINEGGGFVTPVTPPEDHNESDSLKGAVSVARGSNTPSTKKVGFGHARSL